MRTLTEETTETFGDAEECFRLCELLGQGSFGAVYRCSRQGVCGLPNQVDKDFAVKVIDASRLAALLGYPVELVCPRLKREVEILQYLGAHPRILKLFYAFYSETTHRFYLVTELLTGGEVFHAIVRQRKPYSEHHGRHIFAQLVDAVAFCHSMGVAHRDLKLENCIFESKESFKVKLCDYGQAKLLSGEGFADTSQTLTTTPAYTAPEVARAVESSQTYDAFKADSYGLGVVLYGLLCSALPNAAKGAAYERHRQWSALSDNARDLIRMLLSPDPRSRPSPEEIKSHPWLHELAEMQSGRLASPRSCRSAGSTPNADKSTIDALMATQELIAGVQRERGTACWALGGQEGETAYHWHTKYSTERLEEASEHALKVLQMEGGCPDNIWMTLSTALVTARRSLVALRATCNDRIKRRDEMLDVSEDVEEALNGYSSLTWNLVTTIDELLVRLRGDAGHTASAMRLKLLQIIADHLGRERAIVSGHLVRPETLRLAVVVRKVAEVIGARKLLLGSTIPSPTIVGAGAGLVGMLRLGDEMVLDANELSALESVENRILNAKMVDRPAVAEWWHHLTKATDKIHQHIMVGISEFFAQVP